MVFRSGKTHTVPLQYDEPTDRLGRRRGCYLRRRVGEISRRGSLLRHRQAARRSQGSPR